MTPTTEALLGKVRELFDKYDATHRNVVALEAALEESDGAAGAPRESLYEQWNDDAAALVTALRDATLAALAEGEEGLDWGEAYYNAPTGPSHRSTAWRSLMPDDLLDRMTALCEAASPAPWRCRDSEQGGGVLMRGDHNAPRKERHPQEHLQVVPLGDAEFITACREAVPQLVARCRAAEELSASRYLAVLELQQKLARVTEAGREVLKYAEARQADRYDPNCKCPWCVLGTLCEYQAESRVRPTPTDSVTAPRRSDSDE